MSASEGSAPALVRLRTPSPRRARVSFSLERRTFRLLLAGAVLSAGGLFGAGMWVGQRMPAGVMAERDAPARGPVSDAARAQEARPQQERPSLVAADAHDRATAVLVAVGSQEGSAIVRESPAIAAEAASEAAPAVLEAAAGAPLVAAPGAAAEASAAPPASIEAPSPPPPQPALDRRTDPPKSGFGLQVGAFESEAEALAFMEPRAADAQGFEVFVQESLVAGRGRWFRVRLGRFATRPAAEAARARLGPELESVAIVVSYR